MTADSRGCVTCSEFFIPYLDDAPIRYYSILMTTTNTRIQATIADDIREMMDVWNTIESAARAQFPDASPAELYRICKGAMNHALGIGR